MGGVFSGTDYSRTVDGSLLALYGGTAWDNSAFISLSSTTRSGDLAGSFILQATTSSSSYKRLIGCPDGTLTWGDKKIDTIEEQGAEYIRYSSGLQICWGYVSAGIQTIKTFPKSFSTTPSVSVTIDTAEISSGTRVTANCTAQAVTVYNNIMYYGSYYIAIGRWK